VATRKQTIGFQDNLVLHIMTFLSQSFSGVPPGRANARAHVPPLMIFTFPFPAQALHLLFRSAFDAEFHFGQIETRSRL
jgi:hypothetical protein